jgi:hypothetical protein
MHVTVRNLTNCLQLSCRSQSPMCRQVFDASGVVQRLLFMQPSRLHGQSYRVVCH